MSKNRAEKEHFQPDFFACFIDDIGDIGDNNYYFTEKVCMHNSDTLKKEFKLEDRSYDAEELRGMHGLISWKEIFYRQMQLLL